MKYYIIFKYKLLYNMPVQASYVRLYTIQDVSKNDLLSDNNLLSTTLNSSTGTYLPSIIEKKYENFYEFILTNGEKKILILEDILNETHINNITNNNKSLIQYIYLSNNCVSIENNCFKDCSNLELITYINNQNNVDISLNNIGTSAFENCNKLEKCGLFDLSNNIQNIGSNAFKNCNNLYEINIEKSNNLQSLGANAFENCNKLLTINLNGTISFGDYCFKNSGLVNIYFTNNLSNNIGTNIFESIPENASCYYKSGNINGTEYNRLKSIFPNNGSNVVFIENSTLSSDSNTSIENYYSFYSITNNGVNTTIVNETKKIIDSIIKKRNSNISYNIDLAYDSTLSGTTTLGYASWENGEIRLNPDNDSGNDVNFNGTSVSLNIAVLFHEIMHIFGYGSGTLWNNNSNINENPAPTYNDYYFYGKNATYQYNNYLKLYNYNKKLNHVKIEDSGGSGTAGAHIEEGFRLIDGNWVPQVRFDLSENIYPCFYEEIMSGWIDGNNYFTLISAGILQDLGFSINYNSEYIYNTPNLSSYPSVNLIKPQHTLFESQNTNLNNDLENISKLSCKCCINSNGFEIKKILK